MPVKGPNRNRGWIAHAHEVRAILDSRQSQFRRVFKPQPGPFQYLDYDEGRGWHFWHDVVTYEPGSLVMGADQEYGDEIKCPFGKPGDRLWLREKWAMDQVYDRRHPRYGNDLFTRWYAADDSRAGPTNCNDQRGKWRSSVTMPCWASRLTLEVADVRVEQIQDISEEDIKAMGITPIMVDSGGVQPWGAAIDVADYCEPFIESWESVNAKRGFGWDVNPFVWCVSFERIKS